VANVFNWLKGHSKEEPKDRPLILLGIGNPGEKYAQTRHNLGFRCIDLLAERNGIHLNDRRKDVALGQGTIGGKGVVLAKPRTFVNLSGGAARYLATRFGTRPPGILVLLDDLDLPLGTIRMRASGGSGGHNGLNSINAELGTQDYPRLRIGISRPTTGAIQHVLGGFSKEEEQVLGETLVRAAEAAEAWVEHGVEYAMNHFN
jgi:PTH1 family peptidyl-tRNA hydrolase